MHSTQCAFYRPELKNSVHSSSKSSFVRVFCYNIAHVGSFSAIVLDNTSISSFFKPSFTLTERVKGTPTLILLSLILSLTHREWREALSLSLCLTHTYSHYLSLFYTQYRAHWLTSRSLTHRVERTLSQSPTSQSHTQSGGHTHSQPHSHTPNEGHSVCGIFSNFKQFMRWGNNFDWQQFENLRFKILEHFPHYFVSNRTLKFA